MSHETETGSAGGTHDGRHRGGSGESDSPLQTRAAFLAHWGWESVVGLNGRTCARGGAQHGFNSETHAACAADWEAARSLEVTLADTFHFLRSFHRRAPFLFFNGNTFAYIGREMCLALFSDLPSGRRRELASAVAHYIAGVLDWDSMGRILEDMVSAAEFQPGDRVMTLRGSSHGTVVRITPDGRIAWKPDGGGMELMALPESLRREAR
jgi:hypothetical protein